MNLGAEPQREEREHSIGETPRMGIWPLLWSLYTILYVHRYVHVVHRSKINRVSEHVCNTYISTAIKWNRKRKHAMRRGHGIKQNNKGKAWKET